MRALRRPSGGAWSSHEAGHRSRAARRLAHGLLVPAADIPGQTTIADVMRKFMLNLSFSISELDSGVRDCVNA